jgi:hypothetical protein
MSGQVPISDYKGLNNNKIKINSMKNSNNDGLFDFILKNEFLLLVIGFIILVGIAVVVAVLYEKQPEDRENLAFTQFNLLLLGMCFVYIIITFMGQEIDFLGKTFDMGMLLYLAIVVFIMFMLG